MRVLFCDVPPSLGGSFCWQQRKEKGTHAKSAATYLPTAALPSACTHTGLGARAHLVCLPSYWCAWRFPFATAHLSILFSHCTSVLIRSHTYSLYIPIYAVSGGGGQTLAFSTCSLPYYSMDPFICVFLQGTFAFAYSPERWHGSFAKALLPSTVLLPSPLSH